MTLSIKRIRNFIAIANAGQVSQAAMELNASQSAVTTALQQLEAELGVKLFTRRSSGMSLTAEGARFLQHARNIMAAVNEAVSSPLKDDAGLAGRLRVGVTYTVAGYFMPRHHARFLRSFPRIGLELVELPRDAIEVGLVDRTLDIAVMLVSNLSNRRQLAHETLVHSRRRLWLPVEHPLLGKETITLEDVAREPYVMLTVDEAAKTASRYWRGSGLEPKPMFTTSSVEAVRSMVAAGMGVTILSDMVYRPWSLEGQRIETRPVVGDIPTMEVGLAWNRRQAQAPTVKAFHDFMTMTFNGAGASVGH
ncbi:LysR family transcriptional regulator [soil metagenome]